MSSYGTYANFESYEGSVNGTTTVDLARKSRHIIITNDSASQNLQFKFNSSETLGTLKPTESLVLEIRTKEVYLSSGASVDYRIWVWG